VAAGEERLVDNAKLKAIAARLPHGRYVEIPGAYHEILMETDALRAPLWREFDALAGSIAGPGARPG
jgi:lysophospholipase